MRRAPSGEYGSRGSTRRERRRYVADRLRRRTPLNAPVYAYGGEPDTASFWAAGKGVLLGTAFAAGSLALALTLVALVRTDPDDTITDPDDGIAIAGDPTTTRPDTGIDGGKVPLEAPTSSTTSAPPTTDEATTVPATTVAPTTAPPTTAAPPATAAPTTTRPAEPRITSFRADTVFGWCRDRDDVRVRFSWTTTGASDAELGRQGRDSDSVGTNSSDETCARRRSTWVLSVSGPGGTDEATATVPS